jgi:glycerate kinase
MKIVVAPDSFKESLSALDVARALRDGFAEVWPDADYALVPVADGGEGTVDALVATTGGKRVATRVVGPLGNEIEAFWGLSGDGRLAIVEMAAAAGLMLVPAAERNPLVTTTWGLGQLIRAALDAGARRFVVGIGGSATNDAGAGMIQALGGRLLDGEGRDLPPGGGALASLERIDLSGLDPRLSECTIDVACDVDNPLCGPKGASAIFGPQKGATPEMIATLDRNLAHFAAVAKAQLGVDIADLPGSGAAGGLGAGLRAVVGATLRPGVEIVMEAVGMDAIVADADLVVTGEGRIDGQTVHGKTPVGVAAVARRHGCPVIAIAGSVGAGAEAVHDHGIDAVFGILPRPCTLADALAEAEPNLRRTARNVAATLALGGFGRGAKR